MKVSGLASGKPCVGVKPLVFLMKKKTWFYFLIVKYTHCLAFLTVLVLLSRYLVIRNKKFGHYLYSDFTDGGLPNGTNL